MKEKKVIGVVMDEGNLKTMVQKITVSLLPPVVEGGKRLDMKCEIKLENIPHGSTKPAERITFRTPKCHKIGQILQYLVAVFLLFQKEMGNNKEIAQLALAENIKEGIMLANKKLKEWGEQAKLPVEG